MVKNTDPAIAVTNGAVAVNGGRKSETNGTNKRKAAIQKRDSPTEDSESDRPLKKQRRTSKAMESLDDDDDVPLVKSKKRVSSASTKTLKEESDSDAPLISSSTANKLQKQKSKIEADEEKESRSAKVNGSAKKRQLESDSDDDKPIATKKKSTPKSKAAADVKKEEKKVEKKVKEETPVKKGKKGAKKEEVVEEEEDDEEGEEEYKWWEDPTKGDGTKKWETLEHNGVIFPPPYKALPKNVRLRYNGVPVSLPPESEEIACFYGAMLNSEVNVSNPVFNKNFFADFKEKLDETGHGKGANGEKIKILKFESCDFKDIFEYYDSERIKRNSLPSAEKKAAKAIKDEAEAAFQYCLWDGRKQKVGNFRVEPPGLFRGRGQHPKTGKVKQRVQPEQITINIGQDATVPPPPEGHKWKEIKHDQEGTWLVMWQENINNNYKYVMLAANSDIKGQSDHKKFERARELKKHINRVRSDYRKDLKAESMADRQRATAIYLIDELALRAGNEKGEDEADTVGCCSLKYEHITLEPPNKVIFDFLGKDSIRYHEESVVDQQVFKNLRIFKKAPKTDGDDIFDRLTTQLLNKHLSSYMQGLTAKVFRTFNASSTFSRLIKEIDGKGKTLPEMILAYNDANRKVAILCNHKRTVAASHGAQMEKLQDKIDALRYQQYRCKRMMIELIDDKQKKKKGSKYFELPEGLDKEWQKEHHKALVELEREKINKKFAKDNEKLVAEGEKEMKDKELQERLGAADELKQSLAAELKTGKVEAEGKGITVEKLEEKVEKLQTRINTMTIQGEDKKNTSDVALSTSRIVRISLFLLF